MYGAGFNIRWDGTATGKIFPFICSNHGLMLVKLLNGFNLMHASADKFYFSERKVIKILVRFWCINLCFETSNFKWFGTPKPLGPVSPLSLSRVDLCHVVCHHTQPSCPSVIPILFCVIPIVLIFLLPQLNTHKVVRSSYQFPLSPVPPWIFTGFQYFSSCAAEPDGIERSVISPLTLVRLYS